MAVTIASIAPGALAPACFCPFLLFLFRQHRCTSLITVIYAIIVNFCSSLTFAKKSKQIVTTTLLKPAALVFEVFSSFLIDKIGSLSQKSSQVSPFISAFQSWITTVYYSLQQFDRPFPQVFGCRSKEILPLSNKWNKSSFSSSYENIENLGPSLVSLGAVRHCCSLERFLLFPSVLFLEKVFRQLTFTTFFPLKELLSPVPFSRSNS